MSEPYYSIAAVERDTGLTKDTLRVWERRYGFPAPGRDENGERLYTSADVGRLRLIRRLMDQGFRPGRLLAASEEELGQLLPTATASTGADDGAQNAIIALVKAHDLGALRSTMMQTLHREGLQNFVLDTVPRLNGAVGEAWMRGDFEVFEEHLYTEQMQSLLRQAISALPAPHKPPRVLLTTVPDEQHALGLLLSECLLTLEGATCIALGTQTPLADIVRAANAHQADIVALSFSEAFPSRRIPPILSELRNALPEHCALWVGGGGCKRRFADPGITIFESLADILEQVRLWRSAHPD